MMYYVLLRNTTTETVRISNIDLPFKALMLILIIGVTVTVVRV